MIHPVTASRHAPGREEVAWFVARRREDLEEWFYRPQLTEALSRWSR